MSLDGDILEAFLVAQALEEESEQQRAKRSCRQRVIFTMRAELGHFNTVFQVLSEGNDGMFEKHYRMTYAVFCELFATVEPYIPGPTNKRDTRKIEKKERFTLTLRFLITGQSMQSISAEFLIADNTVSLIIGEVCSAIWMSMKAVVFTPLNRENFLKIAQGFASAGNIPHCVGAIDGKHVQVKAFNNSGSMVYNYKKTFSLVLMAICDSNYKFVYVDVGAHGSESDGGIWRRSTLGKKFYKGELDLPPPQALPGSPVIAPFCFVGDEAFGAHQNLLTPYGGSNLNFEQKNFNHHQSATRNIIERCFGTLTKRFQIYNGSIAGSEEKVKKIILATTVLHNFLMMKLPPKPPKNEISLKTDHTHDGYEFAAEDSRQIFTKYFKNNIYTVRVEEGE